MSLSSGRLAAQMASSVIHPSPVSPPTSDAVVSHGVDICLCYVAFYMETFLSSFAPIRVCAVGKVQ